MTTTTAAAPKTPVKRVSIEPFLKDSVEFYQHQADGVRWLMRRQGGILADDMGLGKCQANSEPVLTPSGFVPLGTIAAGQEVISVDGTPTTVLSVHPQGLREMYRVTFSDGSWTNCDLDHLWEVNSPVRKSRGNPGLVKTTREILEGGLTDAAGNRKWYIPMTGPVQFRDQGSLPLDPYLLGVLLGDGCLSRTQKHVTVCTDRECIVGIPLPDGAEIVRTCQEYPDAPYNGTFSISGLWEHLDNLGLFDARSATKFVPTRYLMASPEDRIALLQGLVDTDGATVLGGRGKLTTSVEYGTTSKQLSEDVRWLVHSLGGTVSTQEKVPTYWYDESTKEGKLYYRMILHIPSGITPFRLQRKLDNWIPRSKYEPTRSIVSIEPSHVEEATCIRVDHPRHLFLTRDFIVTHNTVQMLATFCVHVKAGRASTMIVVCPNPLKKNWSNEIKKFTRIQHVVIPGGTATPVKRQMLLDEFKEMVGPKILIINYDQVPNFLDQINAEFFDVAVWDEAHMLKDPTNKRSGWNRQIYSRYSFMLTGSPMPNNVGELWTMLDRVSPGEWGSYKQFVNMYAIKRNKDIVGTKNKQRLRKRLAQVMLRRKKEDHLDLPDVQYIDRVVGITPKQRKLYERARDDLMIEMSNAPDEEIANDAVKFARLLQICGTTFCVDPETDSSEKLDLAVADAVDLVNEGHHIVVFTRWRPVQEAFVARMRKALKPTIDAFGEKVPPAPVRVINGDVDSDDRVNRHGEVTALGRESIKTEWEQDRPGVLCCTYQAAGVGLNMTKARHGLLLDKLYTPGLNKQAVDRMHRIGADRSQPVQILQYYVADTVEHRVHTILQLKQKTTDDVIEMSVAEKAMFLAVMSAEMNGEAYDS